jgi:hypothetical protein
MRVSMFLLQKRTKLQFRVTNHHIQQETVLNRSTKKVKELLSHIWEM